MWQRLVPKSFNFYDVEIVCRIRYHGYKITRYSDKVAKYTMMKHVKDKPNPDR